MVQNIPNAYDVHPTLRCAAARSNKRAPRNRPRLWEHSETDWQRLLAINWSSAKSQKASAAFAEHHPPFHCAYWLQTIELSQSTKPVMMDRRSTCLATSGYFRSSYLWECHATQKTGA